MVGAKTITKLAGNDFEHTRTWRSGEKSEMIKGKRARDGKSILGNEKDDIPMT